MMVGPAAELGVTLSILAESATASAAASQVHALMGGLRQVAARRRHGPGHTRPATVPRR